MVGINDGGTEPESSKIELEVKVWQDFSFKVEVISIFPLGRIKEWKVKAVKFLMRVLAWCQNDNEKEELEKSLLLARMKDCLACQRIYLAIFRAKIYRVRDSIVWSRRYLSRKELIWTLRMLLNVQIVHYQDKIRNRSVKFVFAAAWATIKKSLTS